MLILRAGLCVSLLTLKLPVAVLPQVFYELHAERERQGKQNEAAIVRLEQLAPFPFDLVCRELYRYPNAEPLWCQEEPMNMGAYFHVQVGAALWCVWAWRVLLCVSMRWQEMPVEMGAYFHVQVRFAVLLLHLLNGHGQPATSASLLVLLAVSCCTCQEEPMNMEAYFHVQVRVFVWHHMPSKLH